MNKLLFPLTIMLSARALGATGSGAGVGGMLFYIFLLAALGAALVSAESMRVNASTGLHRLGMGLRSAVHIAAFASLGASLLGLAGYAVNEIFARWFPNLGASFTILVLAMLILFFIPKRVPPIATLLAGGALIAMAVVIEQGIANGAEGWLPAKLESPFPEQLAIPETLFAACFALLGFDLAVTPEKRRWHLPALFIGAGIITAFAWAAQNYISPESLSDTTIPHLILARKAMGQTGRYFMGAAVVLTSFGAILVLLSASASNLCKLVRRKDPNHEGTQKAFAIILGLGLGVLLAVGLAGEPILETFISATVAAWFAMYALFDCAQCVGAFRQGKGIYLSLVAAIVHVTAAGAAGWLCEDVSTFLWTIGGIGLAGVLFAVPLPQIEPAE